MAGREIADDYTFQVAQKLNRRQFERYLRALEVEAALSRGEQVPSALGRLFKPAETERKLVLFTLGIVVILIVVAVLAIEMWSSDEDSSNVTTPLVTLAGTGLGFIGGMVSDRRRQPEHDSSDVPDPTLPTVPARARHQGDAP